MLAELRAAGFRVTGDHGMLYVEPASRLTDDQRQLVRQHKLEVLRELADELRDASRQQVLDRLDARPAVDRAFVTRWEGDTLVVMLGLRGIGTCELAIPQERFVAEGLAGHVALLECLDAVRPDAGEGVQRATPSTPLNINTNK